jgi:hypothetical protein
MNTLKPETAMSQYDTLQKGNTIQFDYKRGNVICELVYVGENQIIGKLMTDYYGRNQDWYTGEEKIFNIKEMKNVKILKYVSHDR